MINDEEVRRTIEIDDFFSVLPAFQGVYNNIDYNYKDSQEKVNRIYRSDKEKSMTLEELKNYLIDKKLV